ncbi:hypothetical protein FACS1894219_02020 [Clostridia bacterium]|nr:hypothetical protein FACS1894219_02020 [Clostridia bacterium]
MNKLHVTHTMSHARRFLTLLLAAALTVPAFLLSGCGDDIESVDADKSVNSSEAFIAEGENTLGSEPGDLPPGGAEAVGTSGEFNPDLEVKITKSARPVRRIHKQDVYGNVLSDDFYFYRNSLDKNEQKIYDQIYANCVDGDPYFEISTRVHYDRAGVIYEAVRKDNPDLFWTMPWVNYTYDGNGYISSMTIKFYDVVNDLASYKRKFYAASDSVLEKAMKLGSDAEKVKFIHDIITNVATYVNADHMSQSAMNQSAYSAIVMGQTVCAGYSMAFAYYMQRLGIPCMVIFGEAGVAHLWNAVKIGGEFYAMDVTWDDPIGNPANVYYYNYFNITDSVMSRDHQKDAAASALPTANGTKYSYANYFSSPGSDYSGISYGSPSVSLPPVYPATNSTPAPKPTEPVAGNQTPDDSYDDDTYYDNSYDDDSYYDKYSIFYDFTDEDWEELWDYLEENLDEEEFEIINDMDWEEFFDFLLEIINS